MARTDQTTKYGGQDEDVITGTGGRSNLKFVCATVPLAIVVIWFIIEAKNRPEKPFYNIPAYITDDAVIRKAAEQSGSFVPLMDMCYTLLTFCVAWACSACYFLGYLRAREKMIKNYLANGKSVLGNVVCLQKSWKFEFRYYGYCSYQHPDPSSDPDLDDEIDDGQPIVVRKKTRIWEPYTREVVPILVLPGYPRSGQGKDDMEFAHFHLQKFRNREIFLGRFSLFWAIVCALVPVYILHQMSSINEREYYAGISDTYDNVDKGWMVYWLFLGIGVLGLALCGNGLAWLWKRYWLLHQATTSRGDVSMHGFEGVQGAESGEEYRRMSAYA